METDYTKWSFRNKLWAALAACGSLVVLAYPPWFFRSSSFRAWIFEGQVTGRLDASRIGIEILAILVAAGLLAFAADLIRVALPALPSLQFNKYTAGLVMMASLLIALFSFGEAVRMRGERNHALEDASKTERILLGRLAKSRWPGAYDDLSDVQLGLLVLKKWPGALVSLPADFAPDTLPADFFDQKTASSSRPSAQLPPGFVLDRKPGGAPPAGDIFDRLAAQSRSGKLPDIYPILNSLSVPDSVKEQAWDAFYNASDPDAFEASFDKLQIPLATKAALWDMKWGRRDGTARTFVPPKPEDMISAPMPKSPHH